MDVFALMSEVATQLAITGLRSYAWHQGTVAPPAVLVGWPDSLDYAQAYAKYVTRVPDLPVLVVVGKSSERAAAAALGQYVAESGAKSVPAAVLARAGSWVQADFVVVKRVSFPAVTLAGVDMLAAEFHLDAAGKGAP